MRAGLAALAVVALGACGGPEAGADGAAVDSTLVDLLAELHLADARAALDTTGAAPGPLADSLRGVALRAHGVGPAALESRLARLADDPARARATYEALDQRLTRESYGGATADDE